MVLVGDNVINETHDNEHAKGYEIDHVLFHPSYEGNAYFDIAVIFTKETIEFNTKVVQTLLKYFELPNKRADSQNALESGIDVGQGISNRRAWKI